MDSFKRFSEEKLPRKKCFYSSVKDGTIGDNGEKLDGHINDEDYLTCKKIWNEFNMKNMGGYHNHYLKKHVLLWPDVFEKFTDTCLKFYGLDTCHYFSSPGLSWDVMLKMTGVKLEKIFDINVYLLIDKRLRGGISYIARDTVKKITNTWKIMILQNRQYTYRNLIWIICMVEQWVVNVLRLGLSG